MRKTWVWTAVLLAFASGQALRAQHPGGQPTGRQPSLPTFQITSRLVFLDVTVLDRHGRPVVTGLTKDDFRITEDSRPQRILSFETPQEHVARAGEEEESAAAGHAPLTIFVLDLLDAKMQNADQEESNLRNYLASLPRKLPAPAELMVIGNESLELVQSWTRSRNDLLDALDHTHPDIPFMQENLYAFQMERIAYSIDALDQIAFQNQGVPGRKNVIWLGPGPGGLDPAGVPAWLYDKVDQVMHATANRLVDARISLFVIYPGVGAVLRQSVQDSQVDLRGSDPFHSGFDFGVIATLTGGKLFYNRTDLNHEIGEAITFGSNYYTITYQPRGGEDNGRFRRIGVTLREPGLRAITKIGYFAPEKGAPVDPQQRMLNALAVAARSTVPFTALHVSAGDIVRQPNIQSVKLMVYLYPRGLGWIRTPDGKLEVHVILASASLSSSRRILGWRIQMRRLVSTAQHRAQLGDTPIPFRVIVHIPRGTRTLRVVAETESDGRMGTTDIARKTIDAAPALAAPPHLMPGHDAVPAGHSG